MFNLLEEYKSRGLLINRPEKKSRTDNEYFNSYPPYPPITMNIPLDHILNKKCIYGNVVLNLRDCFSNSLSDWVKKLQLSKKSKLIRISNIINILPEEMPKPLKNIIYDYYYPFDVGFLPEDSQNVSLHHIHILLILSLLENNSEIIKLLLENKSYLGHITITPEYLAGDYMTPQRYMLTMLNRSLVNPNMNLSNSIIYFSKKYPFIQILFNLACYLGKKEIISLISTKMSDINVDKYPAIDVTQGLYYFSMKNSPVDLERFIRKQTKSISYSTSEILTLYNINSSYIMLGACMGKNKNLINYIIKKLKTNIIPDHVKYVSKHINQNMYDNDFVQYLVYLRSLMRKTPLTNNK